MLLLLHVNTVTFNLLSISLSFDVRLATISFLQNGRQLLVDVLSVPPVDIKLRLHSFHIVHMNGLLFAPEIGDFLGR